jgi:hypothetical protein
MIQKYVGDRIVGLSTDAKPTNISDGAVFFETDTLKIYLLVSGSWSEIQTGGGSSNLTILDKTEDYTIQTSDLGKIITMDATTSKTLTLPSVGSSDIGLYFTIVKKGSGDLVIQASDSDTILDSTAGGTLSNTVSTDVYSALTLVLISETEWIVKGATSGSWVTA